MTSSAVRSRKIRRYITDDGHKISPDTIESYHLISSLLLSKRGLTYFEFLQKLAVRIGSEIGREKFLEGSAEVAEQLLRDEDKYPICANEFRRCLKDFGHRGYNELDVYRKTWDMDARPVIASLLTMMRGGMDCAPKKYESIFTSIEGVKCKLTSWQKVKGAT